MKSSFGLSRGIRLIGLLLITAVCFLAINSAAAFYKASGLIQMAYVFPGHEFWQKFGHIFFRIVLPPSVNKQSIIDCHSNTIALSYHMDGSYEIASILVGFLGFRKARMDILDAKTITKRYILQNRPILLLSLRLDQNVINRFLKIAGMEKNKKKWHHLWANCASHARRLLVAAGISELQRDKWSFFYTPRDLVAEILNTGIVSDALIVDDLFDILKL